MLARLRHDPAASPACAGPSLTLSAKNGQILMLVDKETKYVNTKTYTESLVWWKSVEKGSYSEDIVHNHLVAGGKIVVMLRMRPA